MAGLRILHWNVHMWRDPEGQSNADAAVDLIRTTQPDAVSLVEVDEMWDRPSELADVAAQVKYSWVFIPAFEFGDDRPTGGFGNALLTRSPILAVQQRHLLWPPSSYDGTEPSEARTVTLARTEFQGEVWIGTTHLPRTRPERRAEAAMALMKLTSQLQGAWVICGDFNMPPSEWPVAKDVLIPETPMPTYPAHAADEAIDYALHSPICRGRTQVLPMTRSDHHAVLVDIEWDSDRWNS